ncbi:MAG: hypothetical protein JST40_03610 [Armatimonadetes bacterium]|nr:hypothetical protein [Armatimonadota bacterium]
MSWLNIVLYFYGLINILGGFMGFLVAKSQNSLITGLLAGIVVILLTLQTKDKPAFAYRTLGIVVLALIGFWIYRITEVAGSGSIMMPMMNLVLGIGVLGALGYSHLAATAPSKSKKPAAKS